MKQTLRFEDAWDRTLAKEDRKRIEDEFELAKDQLTTEPIQFTPLQEAINHKGELLIMVLIHNVSNENYSFHEDTLQFIHQESGKIVAEHTFSIPRLIIEKHTSMPWTFIFPKHNITEDQSLHGYLTYKA